MSKTLAELMRELDRLWAAMTPEEQAQAQANASSIAKIYVELKHGRD